MHCAVCNRPVALGQGLANAHAVVCSWPCSGAWNQARGVNYAFGPNTSPHRYAARHAMGPWGEEEDAEFEHFGAPSIQHGTSNAQVLGSDAPPSSSSGGARAQPTITFIAPAPTDQQAPPIAYTDTSAAAVSAEAFNDVVALASDQRARALALLVEVPFFIYVALHPRLPAFVRLGAAALGVMRTVEVVQQRAALEAYLPPVGT